MKIVVWAYPATALVIQLINSLDQQIDDVPIEEENVWLDDLIPTLRKMMDLREVDELLLIGPESFTGHIKTRIETIFPNLNIILGAKHD